MAEELNAPSRDTRLPSAKSNSTTARYSNRRRDLSPEYDAESECAARSKQPSASQIDEAEQAGHAMLFFAAAAFAFVAGYWALTLRRYGDSKATLRLSDLSHRQALAEKNHACALDRAIRASARSARLWRAAAKSFHP
jgi:hypothetical protein